MEQRGLCVILAVFGRATVLAVDPAVRRTARAGVWAMSRMRPVGIQRHAIRSVVVERCRRAFLQRIGTFLFDPLWLILAYPQSHLSPREFLGPATHKVERVPVGQLSQKPMSWRLCCQMLSWRVPERENSQLPEAS